MCNKVYTLDEIRSIAAPIAEDYGVDALYLFGSYARGDATPESDMDFRIDKGSVCSVFKLGGLYNEMEHSFDKKMDIMTTQMLSEDFLRSIRGEEVLIYERGKPCFRQTFPLNGQIRRVSILYPHNTPIYALLCLYRA